MIKTLNMMRLAVTAKASTPELAARIANTMADEYVKSVRDARRESISAAAQEVQKRLEEAKAQILDLGKKIQLSGRTSDLDAELQIATGTYTTLAEKLETLRINEQLETGPGRVVSPAVPDAKAVAPKPLRNGILGLALGLAFGVGMAFLNEYLDNTIKSTDEAERIFGAPVLGTVPVEKGDKAHQRRLAIVESPGSSTAEAYRILRNSLDFINFQHDMRTIVVTSAAPGEGKSTVAANLATALAQAGRKGAVTVLFQPIVSLPQRKRRHFDTRATFLSLAKQTGDPRIAQRATSISWIPWLPRSPLP